MTTVNKKPWGGAITSLVLSLIGIAMFFAFPIYLNGEYDYYDGIGEVFDMLKEEFGFYGSAYIALPLSLLAFAVVFFFHGKLAGKIIFCVGAGAALIHVFETFEYFSDTFDADSWESEELSIFQNLADLFYHICPIIIAILVICALTIPCKGPGGFTIPIYVLAAVMTFFSAIYYAYYLVDMGNKNASDKAITEYAIFLLFYFVMVIPYWVIAILLPPYVRKKPMEAAPYAYAPYGYAPVAPVAPIAPAEPVAPVTPAEPEKKSASAAVAEIKALFDAGLMTEEEFNAKRDEIIGRM